MARRCCGLAIVLALGCGQLLPHRGTVVAPTDVAIDATLVSLDVQVDVSPTVNPSAPCTSTYVDLFQSPSRSVVSAAALLDDGYVFAGIEGPIGDGHRGVISVWDASLASLRWRSTVQVDLRTEIEGLAVTASGFVVVGHAAPANVGKEPAPERGFLAGIAKDGTPAWTVVLPPHDLVRLASACAAGNRVVAAGATSDITRNDPILVSISADGTDLTHLALDLPADPERLLELEDVACRPDGHFLAVGAQTGLNLGIRLFFGTPDVPLVHVVSMPKPAQGMATHVARMADHWLVAGYAYVGSNPHRIWLAEVDDAGAVLWRRDLWPMDLESLVDLLVLSDGPAVLLHSNDAPWPTHLARLASTGGVLADTILPQESMSAYKAIPIAGGMLAVGRLDAEDGRFRAIALRLDPYGQLACESGDACLSQPPSSCPTADCEIVTCPNGKPCQPTSAPYQTPCSEGLCAGSSCLP